MSRKDIRERIELHRTTSRRTFLKAAVATGAVAGFGPIAVAQTESFEFGGEVSGWTGRAPSSVEGETNPTLELEVGQTYEITWENVDGQPHNIAILDSNGEELERTEVISEQGATQTLEFEATEEMAEYYCEVHPQSMRGDISLGGATGTEAAEQEADRLIPEGPNIGLQEVAGDPLEQPVAFAYAEEDEDRRFIVDQNGQIYVHDADGLQDEPFLDVADALHYKTETRGGFDRPEEGEFDERGLLGLAFHPDFSDNGRFYVRYSAPPKEEEFVGPSNQQVPDAVDHTFVLSEFRATDDRSSADPDSERVLLEIPEPQFNHNAGDIAFGPDGYLYVTVGDGGGADDTGPGHVEDWYDENEGGNGQDVTENLLGSLLRIDVDTEGEETPYGIPDDSPLVDEDGFDEQYAWGFRNPWRMSFDDDQLLVADVGQALYEEVNLVESGGNYGWNVKEGTNCFNTDSPTDPPADCPDGTPDDVRGGEEFVDPVIEYPHTHDGQSIGISVTGGYVYRGDALSDLDGQYVFGDWSASFNEPRGKLWIADPAGDDESEDDRWSMQELVVEGGENGEINRFVTAFGRDRDGEMYILASETGGVEGAGAVYKIVSPEEGEEISAPERATPTPEGDETEEEGQAEGDPETTEAGEPANENETDARNETDGETETPAD